MRLGSWRVLQSTLGTRQTAYKPNPRKGSCHSECVSVLRTYLNKKPTATIAVVGFYHVSQNINEPNEAHNNTNDNAENKIVLYKS